MKEYIIIHKEQIVWEGDNSEEAERTVEAMRKVAEGYTKPQLYRRHNPERGW